jgi:hypothetical protein
MNKNNMINMVQNYNTNEFLNQLMDLLSCIISFSYTFLNYVSEFLCHNYLILTFAFDITLFGAFILL